MEPPSEPPSYDSTAAAAASKHRSIHDLRTQIIANGSVMKPRYNSERPSDDHIELIVAKTPTFSSTQSFQQAARNTHWSEKQALAMGGDGAGSFSAQTPARPTSSTSSVQEGKHYAVLMRRSGGSKTVRIILQGEPKGTVEEALEWMLERTEMLMHDLVVRHGRPDNGTCAVM